MPNFFRDNNTGFKPRTNIFGKLKPKDVQPPSKVESEPTKASAKNEPIVAEDDFDSSIDDSIFSYNTENTDNTQRISSNKSTENKTSLLQENFALKQSKGPGNENKVEVEEDLEITEIRDLPHILEGSRNNTAPLVTSEKATASTSAETNRPLSGPSSNDVLLEAFTNTQKICSTLKIDLQKQKNENQKLHTRLKYYETETTRIRSCLSEYKGLLNSLQTKSLDIQKKKVSDGITLLETRKKHQDLVSRLKKYDEEIGEMRKCVSSMNKIKVTLDAELMKKNKDLEYIRQELDDCSGQLTEEKMRNESLLQEINNSRKQTEETINKCFQEILTETRQTSECLKSSIIASFQEQLGGIETIQEKLNKNMMSDYTSLIESKLKGNIAGLLDGITTHILNGTKSMETHLTASNDCIRDIGARVDENIAKWSTSITSEIKINSDTSNGNLHRICDNVISENKKELQTISEKLDTAEENRKNMEHYKHQIQELEKKLVSLEQQKTECLVNLGTKNAEFEDLQNKLNDMSIKVSHINNSKLELTNINSNLTEELSTFKTEYKNKLESLTSQNNNLENKLECQLNINKSLTEESDKLRHSIKEMESVKKEYEVEKTARVERFQQLNEQVQILNLDMIQLKAHELELEEENKNLTQRVNDNLANSEEISDEVKILRQKLVESESEKQTMLSDKLDIQEKFESMRSSIQQLRKQNSFLEKEIAEARKNGVRGETKKQGRVLTENGGASLIELQKQPQGISKNPVVEKVTKNIISKEETASPFKLPKQFTGDEFELSSSSNDDLELTNPSPIQVEPVRTKTARGTRQSVPATNRRKKKLLLDSDEVSRLSTSTHDLPRRKRRK